VVSLFLLTVFGLLLGAGIKGRMVKAGLDTSLPWNTGRKWWQVRCNALPLLDNDNTSLNRIHRSIFLFTQALLPRRLDDIDIGLRGRSLNSGRARGGYIAVSDNADDRSQGDH
jgi:hypothetical protein